MFTVCLINFADFRKFASLEEARAFVEKACFEATVWNPRQVRVATFSPISGWHQAQR